MIGASGYSGEELVRLLLTHPNAELAAITSRQYAGQTLAHAFPRFAHHPRAKELRFSEPNADPKDHPPLCDYSGVILPDRRGTAATWRRQARIDTPKPQPRLPSGK